MFYRLQNRPKLATNNPQNNKVFLKISGPVVADEVLDNQILCIGAIYVECSRL